MVHAHWGLEKTPFPSGLDPRLFYEGVSQREALARLRYLVENDRRMGLVLGAPGLGKSLLLHVFASECRQQGYRIAYCDLLGVSVREFYWLLGNQLGAAVRIEDDVPRLFRQVSDRLQENRLQGVPTIVLLDNADQAGINLITQLERLARVHPSSKRSLSLVLTSNVHSIAHLGEPLLDLVDLRIDLDPWDELDTIGYLQLALIEAGSDRPLFDDQALSELHRLAVGVPRKVSRLADYSLLAGSSCEQEIVDAATVLSVHKSLSLPHPA